MQIQARERVYLQGGLLKFSMVDIHTQDDAEIVLKANGGGMYGDSSISSLRYIHPDR